MEKQFILQELKKYILENGSKNKKLTTVKETDISIGDTHTVHCRRFKYNCKGVAQKMATDIRVPITKSYTSDALWFYDEDKDMAEHYLINYIGSKEIYEELGGCFQEGDIFSALDSSAYWNLRKELRPYQSTILPETITIEDYEETYTSSHTFNPVYCNIDSKLILIGYIINNAAGESLKIVLDNKSNNIKTDSKKINWLVIILGIFWPPLWLIYFIYRACKKK